MLKWMVEFTKYLNENQYSITPQQIGRFFEIKANGLSITDKDLVVPLMQLCFCHTIEQENKLPVYFDYFCKHKKEVEKQEGYQKQKKKVQDKINLLESEIGNEISKLKKERDKKRAEIFQNTYKELDSKAGSKGEAVKQLYSPYGLRDQLENNNLSSETIYKIRKNIAETMETSLWEMDLETVETCELAEKLLCYLESLHEKGEDISEFYSKKINSLIVKKEKEVADLQIEQDALHKKIEESLNIDKEMSLRSREVFTEGQNSVRTWGITEGLFLPNKSIEKLTKEEIRGIYESIRKNSLKLKTRLLRNIATKQRNQIDLNETVKQACKTGGLPMELIHKKNKPSKAKLMVVADISGSCSKASKMVLTFVHALQSVFPSGCKSFVFVNKLYDVSGIMSAKDIEGMTEKIFKKIPVKGVYSDYYKPLNTLWNNYKQEITKDTIILFIGDARNNRNPTGEEFLKNISRKAKSVYWLNTETKDKWGKMDSLAPLYGKYTKMYEILKPQDIVDFLNSMR